MSISNTIQLIKIVVDTTVDGPGWRTSIYCAGCNHRCEGCHNQLTWDFGAGYSMTIDDLIEELRQTEGNITFTGGDPMYQADAFTELARRIREDLKRTIWCYTGFTYEQVLEDSKMQKLLPYLEVLVDGPFVQSQRNLNLLFRGSSNQRLIDVQKSLLEQRVVEFSYNPFPTF